MRAWFLLSVVCSLCSLEAQGLSYALHAPYQLTKENRFLFQRFDRYDVSGDSLLNMREFASSRGNSRFSVISRANLVAFLKADVNDNGLLSSAEYLFSHRSGKVLFSGERVLIFGKADKNQDEYLDAKEWEVFAKRAFEQAPLSYYDEDQNGHVSWTEWLGDEPTADVFFGARMKDIKRVLPESLVAMLVRDATVYADLILGASDNPWTREVVQQLRLFVPARLLKDDIDYLTPVGASFGYALIPPDDFRLPWAANLNDAYTLGRSIFTTSPSWNNVSTGTTNVLPGRLSSTGNSVTTPSNRQTIQLPTMATIPSLLLSTEGQSATSSSNEVEVAPTTSPKECTITVTMIYNNESAAPISQPDSWYDFRPFPLTPPSSPETTASNAP